MEQTLNRKKEYINFLNEHLDDQEITLVIKEGNTSVETLRKREKVTTSVSTIITYILITFLALIMILPFYWMIITSLKTNTEIQAIDQTFFPSVVMWSNYLYVFQVFDFSTYMWNTIVVAIFSTLGTLITTIFAAFAFSRLNFKGREQLFMVFLMTMMIPGEMMVISNFITVASFGWTGNDQTLTDAYLAMIVPFWVSVYYIYLLRQNFKQIPNELYLAAKVDGYTDFKYLLRVMIPIGMPTIVTIIILSLMGGWNSYMWPTLVANGKTQNDPIFGTGYDIRLVSNGLMSIFQSEFSDNQPGKMAGSVVTTLPLFVIFIIFHKYIMKGVSRSGIKG